LLISRIADARAREPQLMVLKSTLIIRESTGVCPARVEPA
jgi:hypothetical protein